jgi:hypothetical protein
MSLLGELGYNNISVISYRSVLFVEETGVHRENHRPVTNHTQMLSHNVVSSTSRMGVCLIVRWC